MKIDSDLRCLYATTTDRRMRREEEGGEQTNSKFLANNSDNPVSKIDC
jgi:hypothetical protein